MKNKLLPVLLAGVLAFALTACGGGDTAAEEETAASQPASETASEVSEPSEVIPGEIVDEDGNYLEGFTSGTDTYEFITYSKPLADKESDEDSGAFDSILDESVVVLPERSLLWHYRSKDEKLIAFSNIKIYN